MLAALLLMILQVLFKDQDACEIVLDTPVIPYGSNLTVFLKAPPSGVCGPEMPFDPSNIYCALNGRKIHKRFYDFNSTTASVSITNVSVEKGTVECFFNNSTPVILGGTFIWTYPPISSPENVSCIGKMLSNPPFPRVTCMWDHDQLSPDIMYTVHLKQDEESTCESKGETKCTFTNDLTVLLHSNLNVSVTAQDPYKHKAFSKQVSYSEGLDIVQMNSPENVIAEPLPTGLRVMWRLAAWPEVEEIEIEVRLQEKGLHTKPLMKYLDHRLRSMDVTEVKPCTNYAVSVRSRYHGTVWSPWSREVTALNYLNVSSSPFHFWRTRSVLGDKGKRTVQLMWQGVPPLCKAFYDYRIFCDSQAFSPTIHLRPNQNHVILNLDNDPHRITVALFRKETSFKETSIEIPAMEKEVNLPPITNMTVFVRHSSIHITWLKPTLPVNGYLIVWNSTAKNHMWQQTLETSFTLKGEPFTVYTISVTPLYKDGPGNAITLNNCSQEKNLTAVSKVQVTGVSDQHAEVHWLPVLPTQCCAFVLNYTVFFKIFNEQKFRNITVGPNQHRVVLEDLQAKTTYSIYVMASTAVASSKSGPFIFSTNPHSQVILIVIIICCVGLILVPMTAMMIQRKFLSKKIPDPRFSSLSMWPSDSCRKPWSLFPVPGSRDTEKILPCHVDSEVICVSPTSKKDIATVKALTDIQNIATHETTSHTKNTPLAASFSNKGLPFGGKDQRVPTTPSLDLQTSGNCPVPPIRSPYRQQTPLNSPVESPTKPLWSDETEALLTPKLKNTTYFTSYVSLDMFDPKKQSTT